MAKPTKKEIQEARFNAFFAGRDSEDWVSPLEQMDRARREEEIAREEEEVAKREAWEPTRREIKADGYVPEPMSPLEKAGGGLVNGFEALTDALVGGAKRSAGAAGYTGSDNDIMALIGQVLRGQQAGTPGAFDIQNRAVEGQLRTDVDNPLQRASEYVADQGQAQVERAEAIARDPNKRFLLGEGLAVGTVDAAASPSSLASLIGGPTAAIPAADVYAQEYMAARRAGLSKENADLRAKAMSGVELAIESIPAGGVGKKILPNVFDEFLGDAARFLYRTGTKAVGEGAEEMATEVIQSGIDTGISNLSPDKATREFAERNDADTAVELWDRSVRAGIAGAVGGGVMSSPTEALRVARERGQAAAELLHEGRKSIRERDLRNQNVDLNQPTQDMFPDPEMQGPEYQAQPTDNRVNVNPIESFDNIRNLQREIGNLKNKQRKAIEDPTKNTFTSQQADRLKSMEATLARYGGDLGLDVPVQPAKPVFDGNQQIPTTPAVNPQDDLARLSTGNSKITSNPKAKPISQEKQREQDETRAAMREAFPDMAEEEVEAAVAGDGETMTLDQLRKRGGLQQKARNVGSTSVEHVFGTLLKNVGKGDVRLLTKLMRNGNVKVVASEDLIPGTAEQLGDTSGYYDGNTTYIVARNVDANNVIGEMLSVAAHEGKHAADVSGNEKLKASVGAFVGDEANKRLVAKIEALAQKDKRVNAMVAQVREAIPDRVEYMLELPAYFINYANSKRDRTFLVKRVADDVVSAVMTGAKRRFGINDVSLEDVAYMSRQLLKHTARNGEQLQGDVGAVLDRNGLQMIMSEKAKDYDKAVQEGRTYDSSDGRKKFIVSDAGSKWKLSAQDMDNHFRNGNSFKLGEIFSHDKLFEQYPSLYNVTVKAGPLDGNIHGEYNFVTDTITVDPAKADGHGQLKPNSLRRTLLHEIQHAVQKRDERDEDFYSVERGRDAKDKVDPTKWRKARKDILPILAEPLNVPWSEEEERTKRQIHMNPELSTAEKVSQILDIVEPYFGALDPATRKKVELAAEGVAFLDSADAIQERAKAKDYERYRENITEAEAFFTEAHSNDGSVESLRGPVEDLFDVHTLRDGNGNIIRRNGKVTRGLSQKGNVNFDKWFGDSKTVDAEGNPIVYYTGTSKDKDFNSFNVPKNGTWFTNDPSVASDYAMDNDSRFLKVDDRPGAKPWTYYMQNDKPRVFPVYIRAVNPYKLTQVDRDAMNVDNYRKAQGVLFDKLRAQGYDSVIFDDDMSVIAVIGDPSQIKSVHNKGNFNPKKKDVLEMKSLNSLYEEWSNSENIAYKALANVLGSFSSTGGLGKLVRNLKEKQRGYAAVYAHRAAAYARRIEKGYEIEGKRLGVDPEVIRDRVAKRLDALDKLPSEELRKRALVGLGREYPSLAWPLMRAYSNVNHLSNQIIRNFLEANPNPTESELKLLSTIANNTFKYTTRMYAVFQGVEGLKFARQMKKDHATAKRRMAKNKNVPQHIMDNYNRWENAIGYVAGHDVAIPDDETLERSSLVRTRGLYDLWFFNKAEREWQHAYDDAKKRGLTNAEAEVAAHDHLINELKRIRDNGLDQEVIRKKAEDMVAGMVGLGDSSNPLVKYYRGFKEDRSILEHREKLPDEIRALFGEIKDPATRLAITLAKQGELVSRARFFLDLRDEGDGNFVLPKNMVGQPGTEKFTAELKGESFGALDGWRTTPAIKKAIDDQMELYTSTMDALTTSFWNPDAYANAVARGAVKTVLKVAQWNKLATVVMDAYNGFANAAGSWFMPIMNGVFNPKDYAKGVKLGWQAVADTIWLPDGTLTKDFEDLIRYELLDSARAQEIRSTPFDYVKKLIAQDKSNTSKGWDTIKRGGKAGMRFGIEAYSMLDAWSKITVFQKEYRYLKDFYEKAGIKKNDGEIKAEAADRTKDTNIGFSRTPGAVRALERVGAVTFLPYFVSVFRSVGMNYVVALKDFHRASQEALPMDARLAAGKRAAERFTGASAALGALTLGLKALVAAATDDEDEERLAHIRTLMFPDARFADSIPLGTDNQGNPIFWRLSRIDPIGPMTDIIRVAFNDTLSAAQKGEHMMQMAEGLLFSNRAVLNSLRVGFDMTTEEPLKNKETKLERIAPATTTAFKAMIQSLPKFDLSDGDSIVQFLDSFTPGQFDWFDPTKPQVEKSSDKVNGQAIAAFVNGMGGRLDAADPGLASYVALTELKAARKEGRDIMNQAQLNLSNPAAMQIFWHNANREFAAMERVVEVHEALIKGMGMTPAEAEKVFKDAKVSDSLTAQDYAMLRRGDMPSTVEEWAKQNSRLLVESSLEQNQNRADKKKSKEEQAEAERRRKAWLQVFKAEGINTEE